MPHDHYSVPTAGIRSRRRQLVAGAGDAFHAFGRKVLADTALPESMKPPVAVAHVKQCPSRIRGHSRAARRHGATGQEITEATGAAAGMHAGAAQAHSAVAVDEIDQPPNENLP